MYHLVVRSKSIIFEREEKNRLKCSKITSPPFTLETSDLDIPSYKCPHEKERPARN